MARVMLDAGLNNLDSKIVIMYGFIADSMSLALRGLKLKDKKAAEQVLIDGDKVDNLQQEIDAEAIDLIRTQSPVAGDLRKLIALLNISRELERVGDYTESLSRITFMDNGIINYVKIPQFEQIIKAARWMLKSALNMYLQNVPNEQKFNELLNKDDEVDKLYRDALILIADFMRQDVKNIDEGVSLLTVAHSFERIADRAVNIAEEAHYSSIGYYPED